uniref:hypothetical protein n=1 Tax=Paenibacillus sp. Marseille-Q4541 TaxID=2831522 RepID=UPI001BABCE7B
LVISAVIMIVVLIVFQVPNNIRYQYEKRFGDLNTFFYGVGIGVMLGQTNYYEEEVNLDETNEVSIDIDNSNRETNLYIYGKFVNSPEPLVVVLNDKVIYNGKAENKNADFYKRYYIEKQFVVQLNEALTEGSNKLIVSSGLASESYLIEIN